MTELHSGFIRINTVWQSPDGEEYELWTTTGLTPIQTLQHLVNNELRRGKVESLESERLVIVSDAPGGAKDRTVITGAAEDMCPLARLATMWLESPKSFAHIVSERI